MKIHKEGYSTIIVVFLILAILNSALFFFIKPNVVLGVVFSFASFIFWIFIVAFFRIPLRLLNAQENDVLAPADGEIVVVEETVENEYFKDKRIQISTFMSPFNVHVNLYPVSGNVQYTKYHKGKFLVAWHPKSSTLNERTTIVVKTENGTEVLIRQIAGAVARRIVTYSKENDKAVQGEQLGFIKFGSRVDVFLPLGTEINVQLNQKVKGIENVLAKL
ncbi:MAG: phosphatidylserine decarboxylase family protein [Bacteroidetes bacterium]|nr:MAG: phosphatidylserine decarboxylase family protein [Bacteroidota bacterium]